MFKDFDVSILAPGMPFDGRTIEDKSLGGSESAAVYLARALARAGARVNLFCNGASTSSVDREGVAYQPIEAWAAFANNTPHDVCIVQRTAQAFSQRTAARLNLL